MDEFERIKNVISTELGTDKKTITMETTFIEDLGADSLDIVELIMGFESEFDIEIPDEDAEEISTVGDAVRYIKDNA